MSRRQCYLALSALAVMILCGLTSMEASPPPVNVQFLTLVRTEHPGIPQASASVVISEKISQRVVARGHTDVTGEFVCFLKSGQDYVVQATKGRLHGYSQVHLNPAPKARVTVVIH